MRKRSGQQGPAVDRSLRGGWDDPNCARPTRGVRDRALREHRDRPNHPRSIFSILSMLMLDEWLDID